MSDEWIGKNMIPICFDCPGIEECTYPDKGHTVSCPNEYYDKYRYPNLEQRIKVSIEKELNE